MDQYGVHILCKREVFGSACVALAAKNVDMGASEPPEGPLTSVDKTIT